MDSQPTATFTKTVEENIDSVWNLFRAFGSWNKWWTIYESMYAFKLNAKGEQIVLKGNQIPQNGGYYTQFVTHDGNMCQEFLHEITTPYTLNYDFVKRVPAMPIESVASKIVLEKISEEQTKITWSSWTKVLPGTDQKVFEDIINIQAKAYQKGVEAIVESLGFNHLLQHGVAMIQDRMISMKRALLSGQNPVWGYVDQFPGPDGFPFPKCVKGLPASEALPNKKFAKMLGRLLEVGYLQAADLLFSGKPAGFDMYKEAAKQVIDNSGRPDLQEVSEYLYKHADDDSEFCSQTLQGCNPLQIFRVKQLSQVPETMRHLKAQEKTIQELITEKRLFILDYVELADFKKANAMYFKAPIIALYKEIIDGKSELKVLAIQLERTPNATIYRPDGPHPNRYKLARYFAACADNQVHEFKYHLSLTHFGMEPIIIAVHNALPETHPVRTILSSHTEETIGINFMTRQTLFSQAGGADATFAIGKDQKIKLASNAWRDYKFYDFAFDKNLEERGFSVDGKEDELEGYFYRDDAAKLWKILQTYTLDFVKYHYKDDSAIQNDKDLQNWAQEMADPARAAIPQFKSEIKTIEELALILLIIIWNGSALHSLLNFPHWPYLGYIPNRPNGLMEDMPAEDGNDITPEFLEQALLPPPMTVFQITLSWLLTMPSETNLMNLSERDAKQYPYAAKLYKNLLEYTDIIKGRNDELRKQGKNPYIFLLPENIAASVNI